MSAETDIAAIDDGGVNTAAEVRTALTSVLRQAASPLGKLTPYKWQTEIVEAETVAASGSHDLINFSGSGHVKSIFLAVGGGNAAVWDGILTVTVDGEETPSIEADLGTLFATHWAGPGEFAVQTPSIYGEMSTGTPNSFGGLFLLPIPFSTSIQITYTNPDASSADLWSTVTYTEDDSPPYRLKCSTDASRQFASPDEVLAANTKTLLDLAAGNAGWLAHHSMVLKGDTANTMLERNIEVQVDREATASYASSGLEDWFGFTFYFQQGSFHSGPVSGTGEVDGTAHEFAATLDLIAQKGGIRFDDGVIVSLATEAAVTTDHDQTSALLYYLET